MNASCQLETLIKVYCFDPLTSLASSLLSTKRFADPIVCVCVCVAGYTSEGDISRCDDTQSDSLMKNVAIAAAFRARVVHV